MTQSPYLPATKVRRYSAFTLIELLTVIAIIGILASIIIPVVGKVRDKAKQAQCVNNIRSWGNAFILYANDHKGNAAIYDKDGKWWYQIANNYAIYRSYFSTNANNYGQFELCPTENNELVIKGKNSVNRNCYMPVIPFDYSRNKDFTTEVGRSGSIYLKLEKVRSPSQCMLFVERSFRSDGTPWATSGLDVYIKGNDTPSWRNNFLNFNRHGGGKTGGSSNVVWCDGHVSPIYWDNGTAGQSLSYRAEGRFNFEKWSQGD